MKQFYLYVPIALLLLILSTGLQAQTTQTKASQSNVVQTQTTKTQTQTTQAQTTQTKTTQTNGTPAQPAQTKISQVDLMKIWLGTWKAEMGNDITCTIECKSIYNGFEFHSIIETKGKTLEQIEKEVLC